MPMPSLPRIAIYTRVSSEEQVQGGFSLDQQEDACRTRLDEKYGRNLYEAVVFSDEGVSGKHGLYDPAKPRKPYRKALTRLKDGLDRGEFDAMCVYGLDRLSRSYSLLPKLIEEVFSIGDVELISVREIGVDVTTPTGRALAQLLNTSNALICDIGGQIVKDAKLRRRKLGYPMKKALGWRWKADLDPNGRRGIERHPDEAATVVFAIEEFVAGKGTRTIAKEMRERGFKTAGGSDRWYKKLVQDILVQPLHYGLIRVSEEEYIDGVHVAERYFEREVFDRVRQMLADRTPDPPHYDSHPEYLLGGLITCGHCGVKLRGRRGQGRHRVYTCQAEPWQQQPECSRNLCRADWVEREAMEHLRGFLEAPKLLAEAREQARKLLGREGEQLQAERKRLEQGLAKQRKRASHWYKLLCDEAIKPEEFREHKQEIDEETGRLQARLREVEVQLADTPDLAAQQAAVERALGDLGALWEQMTAEERKLLLREALERVELRVAEGGGSEVRIRPYLLPEEVRLIPSLRGQFLTKRQMEALWLLGQELSRKEVARQLGQSVGGVNATLSKAKLHLGAESAEAAAAQVRELLRPYLRWLDLEGREKRLRRTEPRWPTLTAEERKVLEALAAGLKGPEIAERLGMSPNTVYVHLHHMRPKLGAANNQQLLKFATEAGLLAGATVRLGGTR